jgi:hypothetical protein
LSKHETEIEHFKIIFFYIFISQVNPKENLPAQICDLCIVQLNVSYNFKRLALKNDFYIRQYIIENGMSLMKDVDDDHNGVETALEIHQIHNVIRTSNRYHHRAPAISHSINSELRRNSTTSSVSGVSTMIVNNGCDSNINGASNGNDNGFVQPTLNANSNNSNNNNVSNGIAKPFQVRPIQIKTEPVDPDEEDSTVNGESNATNTNQSSPTSSNGSLSIVTVSSSNKSTNRPKTPPMIVINGLVSHEKKNIEKEKLSNIPIKNKSTPQQKKNPRNNVEKNESESKPRGSMRPNLRTIQKRPDASENKRKLREAAKKILDKRNEIKVQNDIKIKQRHAKKKTNASPQKNKKGRPRKNIDAKSNRKIKIVQNKNSNRNIHDNMKKNKKNRAVNQRRK